MPTTEEADAHDTVKQLVKLTRLEGVTSSDPKLIPDTVTLHPAVATALSSAMKLTEGAAQRDHFVDSEIEYIKKPKRQDFGFNKAKACPPVG